MANVRYECELCGVVYKNKTSLNRHVREKHPETLKFVCEICGDRYNTIGGLQSHLTRSHDYDNDMKLKYYDKYIKSDDEGYCKYCGKRVKLVKNRFSDGYMKFCHNTDCNVRWYNENSDRLEKSSNSIKKAIEDNPSYLNSKIEYWLAKGYTEVEARKKLSERQTTFSKEICIKKYGEDEGLRIWQSRQDKWNITMDSKSDEEKKRINRLKAFSSGCISKAEKELCDILNLSSQLCISSDVGYVYDMHVGNKIIEYNGDYWHCNPLIYESEFFNKSIKMTAGEKWRKDDKKIKYAESQGYDVLVVWETDYNKDKEKVIQKCLDFIKG